MNALLCKCPQCLKIIVVDKTSTGKTITCSNCITEFRIPETGYRFKCHKCRHELCAPPLLAGSEYLCPNCQEENSVPFINIRRTRSLDIYSEEVKEVSHKATIEENKKFHCVNCNQKLEASADMSGITIACPKCQQNIIVPGLHLKPPPPLDNSRRSVKWTLNIYQIVLAFVVVSVLALLWIATNLKASMHSSVMQRAETYPQHQSINPNTVYFPSHYGTNDSNRKATLIKQSSPRAMQGRTKYTSLIYSNGNAYSPNYFKTTDPAQKATLHKRYSARAIQDQKTYTIKELNEIERLYQIANTKWKSPDVESSLKTVISKYPKSNRAGCAILYLGQRTVGKDKEDYLKRAIAEFSDCFYGDGVQVGAYARYLLAMYFQDEGNKIQASKLLEEIRQQYPDSVDHRGNLLVDVIR